MNIPRPTKGQYAPYAINYINLVKDGDIAAALHSGLQTIHNMVAHLSGAQAMLAYAPGKWTIKEVLLHIADTERIFAYRALRIGRGDTTPLPSFEENEYAIASAANSRSIDSIMHEYSATRHASIALLHGIPATAYGNSTMVNGSNTTMAATAYCIAGHEAHHINILRERYGL